MEAQAKQKIDGFIFLSIKILAGTALGVIVGLIPNAVLSAILKHFSQYPIAVTITQIAVIFQFSNSTYYRGLNCITIRLQTNADDGCCRGLLRSQWGSDV